MKMRCSLCIVVAWGGLLLKTAGVTNESNKVHQIKNAMRNEEFWASFISYARLFPACVIHGSHTSALCTVEGWEGRCINRGKI